MTIGAQQTGFPPPVLDALVTRLSGPQLLLLYDSSATIRADLTRRNAFSQSNASFHYDGTTDLPPRHSVWDLAAHVSFSCKHLVCTTVTTATSMSTNLSWSRSSESSAAWIHAASFGHLRIIRWLHRHMSEGNSPDVLDLAAAGGNLAVVKWLHENRHEQHCTTNAMDWAAHGGHLEVVEWLHHNRMEGCTHAAMDQAAARGHLDIVKWLHRNRTEGCTRDAMDFAANLEVIKWLHHNRIEGCTKHAMNHAACRGDLEAIKWLHNNRTEGCTESAMDWATGLGHSEVLKWLAHTYISGTIRSPRGVCGA